MGLELEPLESETSSDHKAVSKPQQSKYKGPERRRAQRRLCSNRRAMHRFEIDKIDRRSSIDRRASETTWSNTYDL